MRTWLVVITALLALTLVVFYVFGVGRTKRERQMAAFSWFMRPSARGEIKMEKKDVHI